MVIDWNAINAAVQENVADIHQKAFKCALRSAVKLRNAELHVLRGQRGGRTYKKPHTKSYWTASAPGEPPAVRFGTLRESWGIGATSDGSGNFTAKIYTDVKYAALLDSGTPGGKIAPRPYKDRIIQMATPEIIKILHELQT